MTTLVWEEPPTSRSIRSEWEHVKTQLRARRGEWARVAVADDKVRANAIRRAFQKPGFQACQRSLGDGRHAIYARYISSGACSNCGEPFGDHCKVHTIPCCPGKCPREAEEGACA